MGRPREGWKLRPPRKPGGIWHVRFTVSGRQYEPSTGETDHERASQAAERIYAHAVRAGGIGGRKPGAAPQLGQKVAVAAADWLDAESALRDPSTNATYAFYAASYWAPHFDTVDRLQAGLDSYIAKRLARVKAVTLAKELGALAKFGAWLAANGRIAARLVIPELPDKATGTPSPKHVRVATDLTPLEVRLILRKLPRWTKPFVDRNGVRHGRWPLRAFFIVAYETTLRPSTLHALRYPDHFVRGSKWLRIEAEHDKARDGRRVPLSLLARLALEAALPAEPGLIFPERSTRKALRGAARRAGIPEDKIRTLHRYDFRALGGTHRLDAGAPIRGVQGLFGHARLETTARYIRPTERAMVDAVRAGMRPRIRARGT